MAPSKAGGVKRPCVSCTQASLRVSAMTSPASGSRASTAPKPSASRPAVAAGALRRWFGAPRGAPPRAPRAPRRRRASVAWRRPARSAASRASRPSGSSMTRASVMGFSLRLSCQGRIPGEIIKTLTRPASNGIRKLGPQRRQRFTEICCGWKAAGKWLESGLPLFNIGLILNAGARGPSRPDAAASADAELHRGGDVARHSRRRGGDRGGAADAGWAALARRPGSPIGGGVAQPLPGRLRRAVEPRATGRATATRAVSR